MNSPGDSTVTILQKLRNPKVFGMAAFDLICTSILAYLISSGIKKIIPLTMPVLTVVVFIFLMIIAILTHYVTGTPTMLNSYLGINTIEEVLESRK